MNILIFIGTKYTIKVGIVLTKFDTELPEKKFHKDEQQKINKFDGILEVIFDPDSYSTRRIFKRGVDCCSQKN